VRIALAGTPQIAVPTLEWLLASNHELVRVFTTSAKAAGRGGQIVQSDVARWCEENSVDCVEIANTDDFQKKLDDIDCVVVIAFGILLPQEVLDQPTHGFINLHFSELPQWRGAAPVQRAIEHGDTHLGITVFALDAGMDTGPIYHRATFDRNPQMRTSEALAFLATEGVTLIEDTLADISAGVSPIMQSATGVSIASKISKDEALLDWSMSADVIARKILAFYPNPMARTLFRGDLLKVTNAVVSTTHEEKLKPGELHVSKNAVLVGTSDGLLEILTVIPQGKSEMKAADWARGARINPGEYIG
jgi:methionyl-tRNA formyltransferase